jgi:hypothetical protein
VPLGSGGGLLEDLGLGPNIPSEIPKAHHTCMQWWGTLVPPFLARRSESNLNR